MWAEGLMTGRDDRNYLCYRMEILMTRGDYRDCLDYRELIVIEDGLNYLYNWLETLMTGRDDRNYHCYSILPF